MNSKMLSQQEWQQMAWLYVHDRLTDEFVILVEDRIGQDPGFRKLVAFELAIHDQLVVEKELLMQQSIEAEVQRHFIEIEKQEEIETKRLLEENARIEAERAEAERILKEHNEKYTSIFGRDIERSLIRNVSIAAAMAACLALFFIFRQFYITKDRVIAIGDTLQTGNEKRGGLTKVDSGSSTTTDISSKTGIALQGVTSSSNTKDTSVADGKSQQPDPINKPDETANPAPDLAISTSIDYVDSRGGGHGMSSGKAATANWILEVYTDSKQEGQIDNVVGNFEIDVNIIKLYLSSIEVEKLKNTTILVERVMDLKWGIYVNNSKSPIFNLVANPEKNDSGNIIKK